MKTKKPSPTFELIFTGGGVLPEKISLTQLSRAMSAVQRLASGAEGETPEEEALPVCLLDVVRGVSAAYRFVTGQAEHAIGNLRAAGQILEQPERVEEIAFALDPVAELSRIAKALGCSIVLRPAGEEDNILARIEPDSFERISQSLIITSDTTLTGTVERVGGATEERCALRVPFQSRLLYCTVASREVVRALAEHLYEDVVVSGKACLLRGSWRVLSVDIRDVYQPKRGSLMEAVEALREAGAKAWDDIEDPQGFLEEVTGAR